MASENQPPTAEGEPELGSEPVADTAAVEASAEPVHLAKASDAHSITVPSASEASAAVDNDVAAVTAGVERRKRLTRAYGALLVVMCVQVGLYCHCLRLASIYEHDDTCEKDLPNWLWYQGAVGLFLHLPITGLIFLVILTLNGYDAVVEKVKSILQWFGPLLNTIAALCACIAVPLSVFAVIWVIVGSAWTFGIDRSDHTCPDAMYNFAYGYLIAAWIFVVLGIPGLCHQARGAANREELWKIIERIKPKKEAAPQKVALK